MNRCANENSETDGMAARIVILMVGSVITPHALNIAATSIMKNSVSHKLATGIPFLPGRYQRLPSLPLAAFFQILFSRLDAAKVIPITEKIMASANGTQGNKSSSANLTQPSSQPIPLLPLLLTSLSRRYHVKNALPRYPRYRYRYRVLTDQTCYPRYPCWLGVLG